MLAEAQAQEAGEGLPAISLLERAHTIHTLPEAGSHPLTMPKGSRPGDEVHQLSPLEAQTPIIKFPCVTQTCQNTFREKPCPEQSVHS